MAAPTHNNNDVKSTATLQLQDIHLPATPSVWPLAIGWWILLAIILFISIWLTKKINKKLKQKKHQKYVFSELALLQDKLKALPTNESVACINIFLRKVAISVYSREDVASLTGVKWLHLLDQSVKNSGFSKGAGRILIDAPYQIPEKSTQVLNLNLAEFLPLIKSSVKGMLKHQQQGSKKVNSGGGV